MRCLGRKIRDVRSDQRDRDDERGVRDAFGHSVEQKTEGQADHDAAEQCEDEGAGRIGERERADRGGDDSEAVDHQRRCVVDQTLALEDRDDAPRHSEALEDGRCGDRVGGRDDAAERERAGPPEHWYEGVRDEGHAGRREEDQPEREQDDRAQVGLEFAE